MEVVEALAEHSGFMIILDADTLPRMKSAKTPLQMFDDILVHKSIDAMAKRRIIVDRSAPAKPSFANPVAGAAPNQQLGRQSAVAQIQRICSKISLTG
jgi:hypothetical protein